MATRFDGLSPDEPSEDEQQRIQKITEFWNQLGFVEDAGGTTWGVLEALRTKVTDCLARRRRDLLTAEALTAEAALSMLERKCF